MKINQIGSELRSSELTQVSGGHGVNGTAGCVDCERQLSLAVANPITVLAFTYAIYCGIKYFSGAQAGGDYAYVVGKGPSLDNLAEEVAEWEKDNLIGNAMLGYSFAYALYYF